MRYPSVAGQFYSGDGDGLRKEVRSCFLHELGPGKVPELDPKGPRRIRGIVSPHAGFMYSGPVAAHGFAALAQDGFPEVFVILGPNHHGVGGGVAVTTHDFETPLGRMKNDRAAATALAGSIVEDNIQAHRHEHSIEVQMPFIQFFSGNGTFVPISMMLQDHRSAVQVGRAIREATTGRDAVIIASTDFSHYVPPGQARAQDMAAIEQILALNPKGLYDTVRKNRISMCGVGPVMAMLEAVRGTEAKLLKYATSGDVRPMPEVVGYASIVVL